MFYIYLQELFLNQVHCSCLFFFNLHPSILSIVVDDGLDARLVVLSFTSFLAVSLEMEAALASYPS